MSSDQLPDPLSAVRGPRSPAGPREPWLRYNAEHLMTLPLAGQPGHGRTASLRRQPTRIRSGRMEGGYTDRFELICGQCGDHPYLDYSGKVGDRLVEPGGPAQVGGQRDAVPGAGVRPGQVQPHSRASAASMVASTTLALGTQGTRGSVWKLGCTAWCSLAVGQI